MVTASEFQAFQGLTPEEQQNVIRRLSDTQLNELKVFAQQPQQPRQATQVPFGGEQGQFVPGEGIQGGERPSGIEEFRDFMIRQGIQGLAAPLDLAKTVSIAALGAMGVKRENIRPSAIFIKGAQQLGIPSASPGDVPRTLLGSIGGGVGDVAGLAPLAFAVVKALSKVATRNIARNTSPSLARVELQNPRAQALVGDPANRFLGGLEKVGKRTQEFGLSVAETAAKSPAQFAAFEVAGGVGAGVGGHVAREVAPGSAGLEQALEFGGSLLFPNLGAIARHTGGGLAIRAGKAAVAPFSKTGSTIRSERRVQDVAIDPALASQRLQDDFIADLTPAQKTGDPELLSLERTVLNVDKKIASQFKTQSEANVQLLTNELDAIKGGRGGPRFESNGHIDEAVGFIRSKMDALKTSATTRASQAIDAAQQRLAPLKGQQDPATAARTVRGEIEKSFADVKKQERALWDKVPKQTVVRIENTVTKYKELVDSTPKAQREDLPKIVERILPRKQAVQVIDGEALPEKGLSQLLGQPKPKKTIVVTPKVESIKELQGMRSKLGEIGRAERAAGNFNKARLAEEMSEAVLEDMGAAANKITGDAGKSIREALDFSRHVNKTFRQGKVGDILGSTRAGGDKIDPALTLEKVIGSGTGNVGIKGDVGLEGLLKASDSPELIGSVQDFMLDKFQKTAVKDGVLNPAQAQKFLTNNQEILNKFPDMRTNIEDAIKTQDISAISGRRKASVFKLMDAKAGVRAASFVNASMGDAFESIIKARNPKLQAQEIKRLVARDATGEAQQGLKVGAVAFIKDQATDPKTGLLSGDRLLTLLNKPNVMAGLKEILTSADLGRVKRIGKEMSMAQFQAKPLSSIINDTPNQLVQVVARWAALKAAGKAVSGTGALAAAGWAGKKSKQFLDFLTNNSATDIIKRATLDDELYDALLTNTTTKAGQERAFTKFNAWAVFHSTQGRDEDEQQ